MDSQNSMGIRGLRPEVDEVRDRCAECGDTLVGRAVFRRQIPGRYGPGSSETVHFDCDEDEITAAERFLSVVCGIAADADTAREAER